MKYEGEEKDGKKHGQGSCTFSNGDHYVGEWKDDEINGFGTMTYPDGKKEVGEWKAFHFHGQGTCYWPDGAEYVGEWKNDLMDGHGTMFYPDGGKYDGEHKDGLRHGYGNMNWDDGAIYSGYWDNDEMSGTGIYTWPDGAEMSGQWKANKANGQASYSLTDGTVTNGIWENDKLIETNNSKNTGDEKKLVEELIHLHANAQIFDPKLYYLADQLEKRFNSPYAAWVKYDIACYDSSMDGSEFDSVRFEYVKTAADGGIPEALHELGAIFMDGSYGYSKDWELAFIYLTSAKAAGIINDELESNIEEIRDSIKNMEEYMNLMTSDLSSREKLSQLNQFLIEGNISDEVFEQAKKRILN